MYEEFNTIFNQAMEDNEEAKVELIKKLSPLIWSSISKYSKRDNMESLYQDGCVEILESLLSFKSELGTNFLGYIKMRLRHMYLNSQKVRPIVSLDEVDEEGISILEKLIDDAPTPDEKILNEELSEKLKLAVETLTERQKNVVTLFYFENAPIGEIANRMNTSYRTVVNTKSRALKKMRRHLEDDYR